MALAGQYYGPKQGLPFYHVPVSNSQRGYISNQPYGHGGNTYSQIIHYDEGYDKNEFNYNIPVHNTFLPLSDMGGPTDVPGYSGTSYVDSLSQQGGLYVPNHMEQHYAITLENHDQQAWGFPRPTQGIKRAIDTREWVGVFSPKRKKKV